MGESSLARAVCRHPAGWLNPLPGGYVHDGTRALLLHVPRYRLAQPQRGGHLIPVMRVHLLAPDHGLMDPASAWYAIRINGHLGAMVLSAFPALVPQRHGAHTVLTGLLDRSALYGVLAEIEALGLELLEVRQLAPQRESPESGDSRSP